MPPVLDPIDSKVDGLAFLGLSLARNHYYGRGEGKDGKEGGESANDNNCKEGEKLGHPDSYTHQTAFDLNKVIDREYEFLQSTDDNGWLVGGGEAGPPTSYKLALLDSAHVEILRVGTYRKDWGGIDLDHLLKVMTSGSILIPQIEVLPTDVVANPDLPPELEIRFDMIEPMPGCRQLKYLEFHDFEAFCKGPLPTNWQLRFLHNQFFKTFIYPSRFCPGAFHSTILRKADFRSQAHRTAYFRKCASAIAEWRKAGPKPLNTIPRHPDTRPLSPEEIKAAKDKFEIVLTKQNSNDTDFKEPTEEEEEAVAELVDKLASMGPLPPKATMATATANLEVTLDEGSTSDDEETEGEYAEETTGPESAHEEPENEIANIGLEMEPPESEGGEGDKAKTEPTNVIAEGQQVSTFKDEAAETVGLPNTESTGDVTEGVSEAYSDEALAADLSLHSGSTDTILPAIIQGTSPENCHSGIWLFTDRANITHFFPPNFLPPYDTPEKRKIIFDVLKEEWDERSLSWKPCGHGSMTVAPKQKEDSDEGTVLQHIVSAVMDGLCPPMPMESPQASRERPHQF